MFSFEEKETAYSQCGVSKLICISHGLFLFLPNVE